jgi:hypothetical protein
MRVKVSGGYEVREVSQIVVKYLLSSQLGEPPLNRPAKIECHKIIKIACPSNKFGAGQRFLKI